MKVALLAFDINKRRQVIVGRTERPELPNYANTRFFLWDRGNAAQLEPLGPDDGADANHMNDRGIAVGASVDLVTTQYRPVLWQDGTVMDLGMPEGAESADAVDINRRGQVAVVVATHVEERLFHRPFVWDEGQFIELQLMGDAPYRCIPHGHQRSRCGHRQYQQSCPESSWNRFPPCGATARRQPCVR